MVGDDFILYSVGEDFVDEGGGHGDWDDVFGVAGVVPLYLARRCTRRMTKLG